MVALKAAVTNPVRPRWHWLWAAGPLLALLILNPKSLPLDDAYITLHNARVLLSGQPDWIYGSSYLAGATSLVHLALVALFATTDPIRGSVLVGLLGTGLYIAGLVVLPIARVYRAYAFGL